jgi:flagellar biosynthesis protein FlhF
MNIKRFTAPTSREALAKARMAFGEGTLILSNRPTANGVEVVATAEDTLSALDSAAQGSGSPAPQGGRDFQDSRPMTTTDSAARTTTVQHPALHRWPHPPVATTRWKKTPNSWQ